MVNLAPCSCAGAVEYIVHSCSVLVAKPDLVVRCIHRLDHSRICPLANLYCTGAPARQVAGCLAAPLSQRSKDFSQKFRQYYWNCKYHLPFTLTKTFSFSISLTPVSMNFSMLSCFLSSSAISLCPLSTNIFLA